MGHGGESAAIPQDDSDQDIKAAEIPEIVVDDGTSMKVICGTFASSSTRMSQPVKRNERRRGLVEEMPAQLRQLLAGFGYGAILHLRDAGRVIHNMFSERLWTRSSWHR